MPKFNYQIICQQLLQGLPKRTREIIRRRFGLEKINKETLEAVGRTYGLTRERVRQIEEGGLKQIGEQTQKEFPGLVQCFHNQLKKQGGLKKEDLFIEQLAVSATASFSLSNNQILFLLSVAGPFQRFKETKELSACWAEKPVSLNIAHKAINSFIQKLKQKKQAIAAVAPLSYLEISKQIAQANEGLYGLVAWPEIRPKGIRDKTYLVLKKEEKPLHFQEVAKLIEGLNVQTFHPVLPQSVHNELIRDQRFVLIGRGTYALKEWGYEPGVVKEVIVRELKASKRPLSKQEIIKKVLEQRRVKENTILLNLNDKNYFLRNSQGKFRVKEA